MKVIQVGHHYTSNSGMGVIEYIYQISNHLVKEGVDISFVQFDKDSKGYSQEVIDGIRLIHFPKHKLNRFKVSSDFFRWVDQLDTAGDIIFHLHNAFYPPNFLIARYLQKKNIPYVFTPHDSYSQESMEENKILKRIYLLAIERYILKKAKVLHAITSDGVKHISKQTKNKNIVLITNFVPQIPTIKIETVNRQLCYIGRYDFYQKGIDIMLEAFSQLNSSLPDVKFIFVGNYNESEKNEFLKLCQLYQVDTAKVELTGKVSNEKKYEILSQSYAYFQLSRFEGFGLSIVEALSIGRPVIITDKVPIYETILAYNAGYIAKDAKDAVKIIIKLFGLPAEDYKVLSENATKCYMENFHSSTITKQLIHMFKSNLKTI